MSKRKSKSKRTPSRAQRNAASSTNQAPRSAAQAPPEQPSQQEYKHVIGDLKQVTILAAAMFALLIALSFFIG